LGERKCKIKMGGEGWKHVFEKLAKEENHYLFLAVFL
jgi:hypothetical protein